MSTKEMFDKPENARFWYACADNHKTGEDIGKVQGIRADNWHKGKRKLLVGMKS